MLGARTCFARWLRDGTVQQVQLSITLFLICASPPVSTSKSDCLASLFCPQFTMRLLAEVMTVYIRRCAAVIKVILLVAIEVCFTDKQH